MLVGLLLLLTGCVKDMGETCTSSDQCIDGGTCLKGVCSGYDCTTDDDCAEGQVCGQIGSVSACAIPCASEGDDTCPGEMSCQAFEGTDTADAALYCL